MTKTFLCAVLAVCLAAPVALAQDEPADDIRDQVASELLAQGKTALDAGDHEGAKKLFIESLEQSPSGASSEEALKGLRAANEKLGIKNLDDGRPGTGEPVDPYAGGGSQDPVDPYGNLDQGKEPVDPYGDEQDGPAGPADDSPDGSQRRPLMAWGAVYGLAGGLALAGPQGDDGEISGGAYVVGALGAGAGAGLTYLLDRRAPMTAGQAAAAMSAGTWLALDLGLMVDVFNVDGTETNSVYKGVAVGGLLGFGGGALYGYRADPSVGDISLANSFGIYGGGAGLLLGVAMSPPTGEAYSLNTVIGSTIGLAGGMLLGTQIETTRRRMLFVDLGAAAGAALPWALIYPLVSDGGTNNDEQALGVVSTLTLGGGAVAAWFLTRGVDGGGESVTEAADEAPTAALLQRSGRGRWSMGAPGIRPMADPALAPVTGLSLGVDLASGRF